MLNNGKSSFAYDSANRLVVAANHLYTYNAENVRIRSYNNSGETKYTYNTNSKLSQLLVKSLKDPIQNIYMAAKHLDVLRDVDFADKVASELTQEDILKALS